MANERDYAEVLEEYVRHSALLLDDENKYWHEKVDEFKLDMASLSGCLLGQLFGSYLLGKKALSLDQDATVRRGFCPKGSKLTAGNLRRAWLEVARERQILTSSPAFSRMNLDVDYGWEIVTGRPDAQTHTEA